MSICSTCGCAPALCFCKFTAAVTAEEHARACTCHPDDNPPRPCPQKFALSECLELPRELLRNADNTLKYPSEYPATISGVKLPVAVSVSSVTPPPPLPAAEVPLLEQIAAHKKKKSHARIATMKAKKLDKDAVKAGKRWNPHHSRWD